MKPNMTLIGLAVIVSLFLMGLVGGCTVFTPEQRAKIAALQEDLTRLEGQLASYAPKVAEVYKAMQERRIPWNEGMVLLEQYQLQAEQDKMAIEAVRTSLAEARKEGVPLWAILFAIATSGAGGGLLGKWHYGKYVKGFIEVVTGIQSYKDKKQPKTDAALAVERKALNEVLASHESPATRNLVKTITDG